MILLLSLLALLLEDLWAFVLREGHETQFALSLAINAIAILLVWLAYSADRKGWLS
jgi:hypothetical protein